MKKIFLTIFAATLMISGIAGCSAARKTAATTDAITTLGKLGPYLVQLLSNVPALKDAMANANMNTPLSSILPDPVTIKVFQTVIATNFKIPASKVIGAYGSMNTLQDVVDFVAKNGDLSVVNGLK